jgi:hypothetical protein
MVVNYHSYLLTYYYFFGLVDIVVITNYQHVLMNCLFISFCICAKLL